MSWFTLSAGKSGKREVAVYLLVTWSFLTARHFMWLDAATHAAQNEAWTTLTWAVLPLVATLFGVDYMVKSGVLGSQSPAPKVPLRRARKDVDPETVGGAA